MSLWPSASTLPSLEFAPFSVRLSLCGNKDGPSSHTGSNSRERSLPLCPSPSILVLEDDAFSPSWVITPLQVRNWQSSMVNNLTWNTSIGEWPFPKGRDAEQTTREWMTLMSTIVMHQKFLQLPLPPPLLLPWALTHHYSAPHKWAKVLPITQQSIHYRYTPVRCWHPGWAGAKKGVMTYPASSTPTDLHSQERKKTKEHTVF